MCIYTPLSAIPVLPVTRTYVGNLARTARVNELRQVKPSPPIRYRRSIPLDSHNVEKILAEFPIY